MNIQLDSPNLSDLEKKYLTDCIESGFISTYGPYINQFEKEIGCFIGSENVIAIQNGTTGIEMCLRQIGISEGDEVILPVMTFAATVNPVINLGAVPIFVDIDINTWNISANEIKKHITAKTKAIIVVHLYGNPCDMDKILKTAREANVCVIEDATESLGALYKNNFTGTIAEYGVFSFNGNKIITTGGGGAVICKNNSDSKNIKYLINQSKGIEGITDYLNPGFNYRMTNLEASLGLAQMKRLPYFLKMKNEYNKIYTTMLSNKVMFQQEQEDAKSSWWFTSAIFDKIPLSEVQDYLLKNRIPNRRVFAPLTKYPAYEKYSNGYFNNAEYVYQHSLNLPSGTTNSVDDIKEVCNIISNMI